MKEFRVDIVGTNAERYINQQIKDYIDFRRERLSKVTCTRYVIRFLLEPNFNWEEAKKIIAKQFSKKKYDSVEEGIKNFSETGKSTAEGLEFQWKEKLVIEQEKYWLVIFEEE